MYIILKALLPSLVYFHPALNSLNSLVSLDIDRPPPPTVPSLLKVTRRHCLPPALRSTDSNTVKSMLKTHDQEVRTLVERIKDSLRNFQVKDQIKLLFPSSTGRQRRSSIPAYW